VHCYRYWRGGGGNFQCPKHWDHCRARCAHPDCNATARTIPSATLLMSALNTHIRSLSMPSQASRHWQSRRSPLPAHVSLARRFTWGSQHVGHICVHTLKCLIDQSILRWICRYDLACTRLCLWSELKSDDLILLTVGRCSYAMKASANDAL
jgi:hypothetical protein